MKIEVQASSSKGFSNRNRSPLFGMMLCSTSGFDEKPCPRETFDPLSSRI